MHNIQYDNNAMRKNTKYAQTVYIYIYIYIYI